MNKKYMDITECPLPFDCNYYDWELELTTCHGLNQHTPETTRQLIHSSSENKENNAVYKTVLKESWCHLNEFIMTSYDIINSWAIHTTSTFEVIMMLSYEIINPNSLPRQTSSAFNETEFANIGVRTDILWMEVKDHTF